ncbi:unnamed protein product [Polarella glacialis]|uniref:Sulfhydryl oxidase n=1 Tax=Polarella glacialis TaxID=89957 RepID=A0A813FYL6_POLGL|nr:unnamed protein product [Polarella glacialis]CAE8735968.1 unnamed protein product [Polarella glacialis]
MQYAIAMLSHILCLVGVASRSGASGHVELLWSPEPQLYETPGLVGRQKSLFKPGGAVHVLTGACKGDPGVQSRPDAVWVVDYYSDGCPHCWYFAPVFQQLAQSYDGSPAVHFGACNCAEESNRDACFTAQAYSYPTVVAYNLSAAGQLSGASGAVSEQIACANDEGPLSARDLSEWLTNRSASLAPPWPQVLSGGADFQGDSSGTGVVAINGPPGPPGWPETYALEDDRFAESRLGLVEFLSDGYSGVEKYSAALRVVTFVARVFPVDGSYFSRLVRTVEEQGAVPAAKFRRELESWKNLFGRRHSVFCKVQTCSMWQLLHVVTASVAGVATTGCPLYSQQSEYQPSMVGVGNASVAEAMAFIRDVVDNFLTCSDCRKHFLAAYDTCLYGRCDVLAAPDEKSKARAMVLWLWRTHNAVSMRVLATHPSHEGSSAVDRRWPAYRDCPGCWRPEIVVGTVAGHEPDTELLVRDLDAAFDLDHTFGFLMGNYVGKENLAWEDIRPEGMQKFLLRPAALRPRGYMPEAETDSLRRVVLALVLAVAALLTVLAAWGPLRRRFSHSTPAVLSDSLIQMHPYQGME